MMNFLFFSAATLGLVVVQTIILPSFSWFPYTFDLLIVLVLYLSLVFSNYSIIFAIFFIGMIMDSLSSVPFFFHVFSYFWVYLSVQVLKQVVFQRSALFMLTVSLMAVLVQQALILFTVFLDQGEQGIMAVDFSRMAWQLVLGGLCITPGIWVLSALKQNTAYMVRQFRRELARRYRD